ncbi:MAG TPA: hypothetical protein VFO76_03775 [Candidatus Kapabacteria bacterium]|nr:hypothetical protein [Candidatus Kapabacteria bacterium]
MKVIFLFMAVFLVAISMGSCGNSTETAEPMAVTYSNAFFPLEVGNYWTYVSYFNYSDTLLRCAIIDTVNIGGSKYFRYAMSYTYQQAHENDTLYLRFINNSVLNRYIYGKESAYINFDSITYSTNGIRYPGLVIEYPSTDSVPLGRFDSSKVIVFRGIELEYSKYVMNIGPIVIGRDPLLALARAKVGTRIY